MAVTHDELLALLKPMTNDDAIFMKDALRAVVELHKPMLWKNLGNDTQGYFCQHCDSLSNEYAYRINYPCSTIQAIEKGLE